MSLIPDRALAPLEAIAESTLDATGQLLRPVSVRDPGTMKYVTTYVEDGAPFDCLLVPASAGGQNIRADVPSVAGEWVCKMPQETPVTFQHRIAVSGASPSGVAWTRLLAVRRVLWPRRELLREALCVDVGAAA